MGGMMVLMWELLGSCVLIMGVDLFMWWLLLLFWVGVVEFCWYFWFEVFVCDVCDELMGFGLI